MQEMTPTPAPAALRLARTFRAVTVDREFGVIVGNRVQIVTMHAYANAAALAWIDGEAAAVGAAAAVLSQADTLELTNETRIGAAPDAVNPVRLHSIVRALRLAGCPAPSHIWAIRGLLDAPELPALAAMTRAQGEAAAAALAARYGDTIRRTLNTHAGFSNGEALSA